MSEKRLLKTLKKMPILKTRRLTLRKMRAADYKDMYEYAKLDTVTRYLLWYEHPSEDYTYNFLSDVEECYKRGGFHDWAVTLSDSGKMIGTCGFTSFDFEHKRAEVGYVLNPAYWGQGIATEAVSAIIEYAFTELDMNRVEAHFIKGNDASLRVSEKCGMTFEGYLKQYMLVKDEYKTIGFSAITRDRFIPKKSYTKIEDRRSWFFF